MRGYLRAASGDADDTDKTGDTRDTSGTAESDGSMSRSVGREVAKDRVVKDEVVFIML